MIFDTHAHLDADEFNEDRDELLSTFHENKIGAVVNVAASISSTKSSAELSSKYDWIYTSVGVHPDEVGELNDENLLWLYEQAKNPKCVAIGEIGLDYYWNKERKALQEEWFVRQLDMAREVKKPLIIHSREAAKDTLDILRREKAYEIGGVIHCFSYSWEMAREYLDMGFFLGIGGVLTFKNGQKLKEVVKNAPIEKLVLETDSPYLAPVPYRGKRNSSLYLPYVVGELARIKGLTPREVEDITWNNARALYRL